MEEVLGLHMPMWGERLPWESIFRSIVVIAGLFIMGMSAQYFSREYITAAENAKTAGRYVQKEIFDEEIAGISDKNILISDKNIAPSFHVPEIPEIERPAALTKNTSVIPEKTDVIWNEIPDIYMPEDFAKEEERTETPAMPVILKIYAYGNGGIPELSEISCEADTFAEAVLPCPKRKGKLFDGWYMDEACTLPFTGETGELEMLEVYAGWKEYPGFTANDSGYITNVTGSMDAVIEGLLRLPDDEGCTGIESGALGGLEESITEVFIPANITYIAPGVFEDLSNLMYIEVMEGNPAYYSEYGILYYSDGGLAAYPPGRKRNTDE